MNFNFVQPKELDRPPQSFLTCLSSNLHSTSPPSSIYKPLNIVGKGAYGSVWRGCHIQTGFVVAIKVIDFDLAGSNNIEDDVADIQREVSVLSRLKDIDNKNVTRYYGCHLEGPKLWIIMDYAGGGSVRTLMKAQPTLDEKYVVVIVRECLYALSFLHKSGIMHRDIKAANILINSSGKVLLCDFGVSASLPSANSKRTTFIGTPYWMAPEVIADGADAFNGREYDTKADIWSLGITMIEMCQGRPPFSDQEAMKAILLITKSSPPRLTDNSNYSKEFKDFVASCLMFDPKMRPSPDELLKSKLIKSSLKTSVSVLRKLQLTYKDWQMKGGQRASLAGQVWDDDDDEEEVFNMNYQRMSGWDYSTITPDEANATKPVNETINNEPNDNKSKIIAPRNRLLRIFDDPNEEDEDLGQSLGISKGKNYNKSVDGDQTMKQIDLNAVSNGDGIIDLSMIDLNSSNNDNDDNEHNDNSINIPFDDNTDIDEDNGGFKTVRASYGAFQPSASNTNLQYKTTSPLSVKKRNLSITSSKNSSTSSIDFKPSPKLMNDNNDVKSNNGGKSVFEGSFAFRSRKNSSPNESSNNSINKRKTSEKSSKSSIGSISPSFQFPPPLPFQFPNNKDKPSPKTNEGESLFRSHSHDPSSSGTNSLWDLEDINQSPIDLDDVPLSSSRSSLKRRPTVTRNSSVSVMETIPSPDLKPKDLSSLSQSTPSSYNHHRRISSQHSTENNNFISNSRYRNIGKRGSRSEGQVVFNPSFSDLGTLNEDPLTNNNNSNNSKNQSPTTSFIAPHNQFHEDNLRTPTGIEHNTNNDYIIKPLDYNKLTQNSNNQSLQSELCKTLDGLQFYLNNIQNNVLDNLM